MPNKPKGLPKTGGRQKGSLNKRTLQVEELAARFKLDPFEILLMIACADWKALGYENECYFKEGPAGEIKMGYVISPEMRLHAAKEAAKYLYSQKQSVALSTGDSGIKIIIEDYSKKND